MVGVLSVVQNSEAKNNIYDPDTYSLHHEDAFPKGNDTVMGRSVAETDMKSMSRGDGVYYPEYIANSKSISFHEDDNDDTTWVTARL